MNKNSEGAEVELSRGKKILLGFLTVWPWIYIPCFMIAVFSIILLTEQGGADGAPLLMFIIIPFHFLTIFLIFILMGFYVYHSVKNKKLDDDKRLVWILALFFGNMIVMPVYWYMNIWKEPETPIAEHFS